MKNPFHGPKLLLLTLPVVSALAFGAQLPRPVSGAREPHPLDALDRAVQKRFHNVIGFGMARIASERHFEPTTEEEKAAVAALKREGYRVGLYLAGRGVLYDEPVENRVAWNRFGGGAGRAISGPIYVSSSSVKSLPGAVPLWDETRRALESFAAGRERHEFTAGLWRVEARAVRASAESCLECHRTRAEFEPKLLPTATKAADLKVGDPLGVLLYAYRKGR
ncbi:MAG: hypothetical protein ABW250_10060 [Pyrinomonadaceae bacterium]